MAKILIMDDEPGLRNVVFGMLKPTGHTIFVTEDGTQAVETAKKEKPDLALLDMRVPDMDGLEVVAALKQMDPKIQCVMLSGFGDVESAVAAIKQGAFDYISKPFKLEEVMRVVNKALTVPGTAPAGAALAAAPTLSGSVGSAAEKAQGQVPSSFKPKSKAPLWIGLGVLALGVAGFFGWKTMGGAKWQSYPLPYANASALAWDGQNLWVSDWASQSVYKHKADESLSIDGVFQLADNHATGLAWDGDRLWSCSTMEKKITKHNMDANLTAVVGFPNPLEEPTALAWDGVNLWCADAAGGKLYKLKPTGEGLSIAGVHEGAATSPAGMFFHQGNLYVADGNSGKIYQQDPNSMAVLGVYGLEPYMSKTEKIGGMASDGQFIWSVTQKSSKVLKHKIKDLEKLNP